MNPIEKIPGIIKRLYELVAELEEHFPGRPFTPDGHLVGSLGEVLAAYYYDLTLLPCSTECHDARSKERKLVQVKATQGKTVALRAEPEHLLVLLLLRDGTIDEVYNGPGKLAWEAAGPRGKNGQCPVGVAKLRRLMLTIPESSRLQKRVRRLQDGVTT